MYIVMNKEENRVFCTDDKFCYLSDELYKTSTFKPKIFDKKYKAYMLKLLFWDAKIIKCEIKEFASQPTTFFNENYEYQWLRLKGNKTFTKVWNTGAKKKDLQFIVNQYFEESESVMLTMDKQYIGHFPLEDFEMIIF